MRCASQYKHYTHTHTKSDLVYGARDEALDVLPVSKYLREGGAERRCCLYCGKSHLANVVRILETEDALSLIHCHTLLNPQDLTVEIWLRTSSENNIIKLL